MGGVEIIGQGVGEVVVFGQDLVVVVAVTDKVGGVGPQGQFDYVKDWGLLGEKGLNFRWKVVPGSY